MVATSTTIFVVDDDDFVRDALKSLLKSAGFKVEVFESAHSFLNRRHPQRKGMLVLDVRMPGKGGLELQRELADSGVAMPIIFVTAYRDVQARAKAMAAGAVAFLQKPFDERDLLDAIYLGLDRISEGLSD